MASDLRLVESSDSIRKYEISIVSLCLFINHTPTISSSVVYPNNYYRADVIQLGNKINRFLILLNEERMAWALL
jgi:hypothetical protein